MIYKSGMSVRNVFHNAYCSPYNWRHQQQRTGLNTLFSKSKQQVIINLIQFPQNHVKTKKK